MNKNNESSDLKEKYLNENLSKIKNKIVVISGKGGVGKSTVSVNLAYALALNGNKVGIMDVDIHGPSIAKMTGIEGKQLYSNEGERPKPIEVVNNFFVLSIASMLESSDDPVIWRGPMKMNIIKQFLEDIDWPELDYLIVDCPPGTGDEPLSVIQLLKDVTGTIIVSTPQDVAFLDARKTINFSKKLNVPILGIIENMSGFICPKCGEKIDIFKSGGAEKAAKDFKLNILGKIPIDTDIVNSSDNGKAYVYNFSKNQGAKIFKNITERILEKTNISRGE
ncbi:MAG: Mrp/NBP35 family ATP-binding protein [Spirochaetes bacterium]|nr:Mrp/NBP35 family ATP-binding protein [Spirochaetota bacterium]